MRLVDKLASLSSDNIVVELDHMLQNTTVTISWWGNRLVSLDGYEGEARIDEVASKYLHADAFHIDKSKTLQDRLDCYALWDRVQQLYIDSDTELQRTSYLKYFVPVIEFFFGSHLRYWMQGDDLFNSKNDVFYFKTDEFKARWPHIEFFGESFLGYRKSTVTRGSLETTIESWKASKEMIESALAAR